MRRLLPAVLAAALFVGLLPGIAAAADPLPAQPAPPTCRAGWVFTETQSWWDKTGLDLDANKVGQHVHAGLCWPLYGSVPAGPVDVSVRVIFHKQPPENRLIRLRMGTASKTLWDQTTGLPALVNDAPVWLPARLDFSGVSGLQELRFSAMVQDPAGVRQYQSAGLQFYVGPDLGTPTGDTVARSWYDGHGYQAPGIRPSSFPFAPVHGVWSPYLRLDKGSGSNNAVTEGQAAVDPDTHNGNPGWIVKHTTAAFRGTVPIDTSRLAPGWHRLAIESSSGPNAGNFLIWFEVS